MTRLFIRFYLGVLLILFSAWLIQSYVFSRQNVAENVQVVEQAYSGGVRLAREELQHSDNHAATLVELRKRFGYAVFKVPVEKLSDYIKNRFKDDNDVVLFGAPKPYVATPLDNGTEALVFGPLPEFVRPSTWQLAAGLAVILLLAAVAIAVLLRTVVRQLRLVERAARDIAEGDYSARVESRKAKSVSTLATAFNTMAAKTESVLQSQRDLLQAVSHELRTPLSRINFAIDLIRQAPTAEEREHRLQSMERASEELDELVGELLHYVRLEGQTKTNGTTIVPIQPIVKMLFAKYSELFPDIHFEMRPALLDGTITVFADPTQFERVLSNLLANASRYAKATVVVDAHIDNGNVVVDIQDDGPGIAAAERERVFQPFVRLDESSGGTGLGLAIVSRIIAKHDGTAEVRDVDAVGCCIRTTWPAAVKV